MLLRVLQEHDLIFCHCGNTEVEIKLGDKSSAAKHISSALAALQLNTHRHPENEFMLSPFLGRCLYLSGCDHFHSGDFVMAEGLFRASMDKFRLNTFCEDDTR